MLTGGAGSGKTQLLCKKLISESSQISCLVVTRLPRLLSMVKNHVEKERDIRNITFLSYDDLMAELAFKVQAPEGGKRRFAVFSQVQFGDVSSTGENATISFAQEFMNVYLTVKERKRMKASKVEALTLFTAIRTIKSNSRCLEKLEPLSRDTYMQLPDAFGLDQDQRALVFELFEQYQEWGQLEIQSGTKPTALLHLEIRCIVDEAQDFSELDLNLFVRMSRSVKSALFAADGAQSVEIGLNMRKGTVHDVLHASIFDRKGLHVKDVLQTIQTKINHRTHEQNLRLSKAVRNMMTRSFQVPGTQEHALITGKLPQVLTISGMEDLKNESIFRAANIVFLCPDEMVQDVKSFFVRSQISCDVFGVREAKGLEYDSVALFQFFDYFDRRKDLGEAWRNALRWMFSKTGVTAMSSNEWFMGKPLDSCDYLLSHPELQDQAAMWYTAITRARNRLYLIEVGGGGRGLGDYAFRCLTDKSLALAERVEFIDEGFKEMTPQQHKARGVQLVTQAFSLSREKKPFPQVKPGAFCPREG
ncbi:Tetratricopeptide repeat and ankyrin repeat containing 1 [Seminavis robusta]|uniref:Tetratricopeptide repeat and ankyrin repeat containing 1 n=1 Tax=Seminavis robusta TaxID=568900 RepID=A0A9N8ERQ3_9STRA|nr:Tetratricopeptide repeat and ankyrin repeat containing 1 [Seminavis robusta]|eukprot:Sro1764_g296050.1 Tetratricopeptide repeat and ankyrin repeat containing 1 (532) ;mRNA; f:7664-9790